MAWKVRIFSVAAALGLVGIALEARWLTGLAIVTLLAGFMLRFLPSSEEGEGEEHDDEGS